MPLGLAYQFLRERQQREDIFRLIEMSQSRHIGLGEPTSARREAPDDGAHPLQMIGPDAHIMSGDGFQAARKIGDPGCRRAARAVEKKSKSDFESIDLDEIAQ